MKKDIGPVVGAAGAAGADGEEDAQAAKPAAATVHNNHVVDLFMSNLLR
jgi:uncharacterized protein GlcG (DUF336 family)